MRVALMCGYVTDSHDAIAEYSRRLGSALDATGGFSTSQFHLRGAGIWAEEGTDNSLLPGQFDVMVLQYNPYSFGNRGRAPWLAEWWSANGGVGIARVLLVHEAFTPAESLRTAILGYPQKRQLHALRGATDVAVASCGPRVPFLKGWDATVPVHRVGVGSNIDPTAPIFERGQLDPPTLVAFGTGHPSRLLGHVAAAANAVAAALGSATLLHLGADTAPLQNLDPRVTLEHPGAQSPSEISTALRRADLALLPFANGVASNRTTIAAALAHGVPVLTTSGPITDSVLRTSALRMLPPASQSAFAAEAARLLARPVELAMMAESATRLHAEEHAWPVIAARVGDALRLAVARAETKTTQI